MQNKSSCICRQERVRRRQNWITLNKTESEGLHGICCNVFHLDIRGDFRPALQSSMLLCAQIVAFEVARYIPFTLDSDEHAAILRSISSKVFSWGSRRDCRRHMGRTDYVFESTRRTKRVKCTLKSASTTYVETQLARSICVVNQIDLYEVSTEKNSAHSHQGFQATCLSWEPRPRSCYQPVPPKRTISTGGTPLRIT